MIDVYLFDWGDTLMVDTPGMDGKMCEWLVVSAVDGALPALQHLSKTAQICIATGAVDSSEEDVKKALARVGLHRYISTYYCPDNLGCAKGSPEFLATIVGCLDRPVERIAMVGDSLEKDIIPAAKIGMQTIWLSSQQHIEKPASTKIIGSLHELCNEF
jgi:putative hydrolase of the HAD superfamily